MSFKIVFTERSFHLPPTQTQFMLVAAVLFNYLILASIHICLQFISFHNVQHHDCGPLIDQLNSDEILIMSVENFACFGYGAKEADRE